MHAGIANGVSYINDALASKTTYNDPSVFERLRVHSIDDSWVTERAAQLRRAKRLDFEELVALERGAEEDPGWESDSGMRKEDLMCSHLEAIFEYIQCSDSTVAAASTPDIHRHFKPRSPTAEDAAGAGRESEDAYNLGFPQTMPDFTLLRDRHVERDLWCDRDGFVLVKATKEQHPFSNGDGDEPTPLAAEAADHARVHLSARPFAVFAIGMLIYGSGFCVAIFDRDGVVFSPGYDIQGDLETFVCVVRSLTRVLSPTQVGQDPSVERIEDGGSARYVIQPVGDDKRRWVTDASYPIWASLSLLGRCTTVWRVKEYDGVVNEDGKATMIVKTAWRSTAEESKAKYYDHAGDVEGLARYVVGDDVRDAGGVVSVHRLRGRLAGPPDSEHAAPDLVLHRIVLGTVVRPLWEYGGDLELLRGLKAALEAHNFLFERGILHRDISPGSVLLAENPSEPQNAGFLTDLDCATLLSPAPDAAEPAAKLLKVDHRPFGENATTRSRSHYNTLRVGGLSGTMQFMATGVLRSITEGSHITQTRDHDVESFAWVLAYSVLRKLRSAPLPQPDRALPEAQQAAFLRQMDVGRKGIDDCFARAFLHASAQQILQQRESSAPFSWMAYSGVLPFARQCVTGGLWEALQSLAEILRPLRHALHAPAEPASRITYEQLHAILQIGIQALQAGQPSLS